MADVSVNMGVSGISQFKQGMNQAAASVKTLDAALKANEKAFQKGGDAQEHYAAQANLLNQKLKQQQQIISNAEKALAQMEKNGKTNTIAYQNMQRKLIETNSAMMDTQEQLDNLGSAAEDAAGKTDKLESSLGGLNKKVSLEQVISGIDSITNGLESAAKKAVQLGKDLWDGIMDSAKWADDTATMAQMYGIDLDTFQRMQKLVTNGLDTSVDAILTAQTKLNKNIGKGAKETMETMRDLGLLFSTGKGEEHLITEDSVELFWKAGQALMAMDDAFDKEAAAQAMFGRSWKELIPLFTEYKSLDEYNAALAEQNVVSEDTVKSLAELNDEVGKLIGDFETLKTETIGSLAPALTKGAEALDGLLSRILEYLDTPEGQQALDDLGKAVEGLFSDLDSIDPEEVVQGFSDVFNKVVGGVQWIVGNKDAVIGALKAIVIGWGALEITGGALQIVKLIQGISGLAAGGSEVAAAGAGLGAVFTKAASIALGAAPWLAGLAIISHISPSAGPDIDQMYANGQVTEAGWEHWRNNPEQWNARLMAVGNAFGDLGSISKNAAALNIIGDLQLDDEAVIQKLQNELGLVPINAEPVVPENAAEDIANQVGTVFLPAELVPTGRIKTPKGWVYPDGENANGIWSVPFDGYGAILHKGERVVPAREVNSSRNFSSNLYVESMYMNNGQDAEGLAAAIAAANRRTMRGYGS